LLSMHVPNFEKEFSTQFNKILGHV